MKGVSRSCSNQIRSVNADRRNIKISISFPVRPVKVQGVEEDGDLTDR